MTARSERQAVTPLRSALTTRGRVLILGCAAVLAAGLWLDYPELTALATAGLAAVLLAFAATVRTPSLEVERSVQPMRVRRGDPAHAELVVRNRSRWKLAALAAADFAGPETRSFPIPQLRSRQAHPGRVELPTRRRGVVASGPLLVSRADAFGLARRTLDTGSTAQLLVRPRAVDLPQVAVSLARSVDGPQSETTLQGTLAFHSLREYVPGDEPRHVHWRSSAHAGQLLVKQHVDTAHAALVVVFDTVVPADGRAARGTADDEAFETAVDCAASIATSACKLDHPLVLVDHRGRSLLPTVGSLRASHGVDDILDALTPVRPDGADGPESREQMAATLRSLAGRGRGSLAALVSTRPSDHWAPALQTLAASYARVAAVEVAAADLPFAAPRRVGGVSWLRVGRADDLPAALARAWKA